MLVCQLCAIKRKAEEFSWRRLTDQQSIHWLQPHWRCWGVSRQPGHSLSWCHTPLRSLVHQGPRPQRGRHLGNKEMWMKRRDTDRKVDRWDQSGIIKIQNIQFVFLCCVCSTFQENVLLLFLHACLMSVYLRVCLLNKIMIKNPPFDLNQNSNQTWLSWELTEVLIN